MASLLGDSNSDSSSDESSLNVSLISSSHTSFRSTAANSPTSLKKKMNSIFKSITKKNKCRFGVKYETSGEAFLTKPNKTTYMIQNTIKKITGINPSCQVGQGNSKSLAQ